MSRLEEIVHNVIDGQADEVRELTRLALTEDVSITEILNKGLIAGMDEVGERFRAADMFIPEVLMAAQAMHAGMDIVKPLLVKSGFRNIGKVVLGTVKGDIHDIGKNLVGIMLTGAGFEVIDIGTSVTPQKFIEAVMETGAGLMAMSALLTVTMPAMKDTILALKEAGLKNKVKTIIGGATVTQAYADEIGADGYARDAPSAVLKAKELLNCK